MNILKTADGREIPFPVETPFAMRPNMKPWSPGEPIVVRDQLFEEYIEEKKKYYGPVYGDNVSVNLIREAVQALKKYDTSFVINENQDGLVYELTMALQEDWVLFSRNKSGKLSAQILSVHLPSGWDPREKVNMTFAEIHEPVADNNLIMKAADHIAATICQKGPFVRHVWAVSNTGGLNRRPDLIPERNTIDLDHLWYRCERQVTIPVNNEASLFLIRVFVVPLREVFSQEDKKKAIIDSINSMSDAVIDYKGYGKLKEFLSRHDV